MPIDRTLWNRRIKVRDGVEIAADVLLPPGEGPFPIVVIRTPYGRTRTSSRWVRLLDRGYGMVLVDMRGRGDSDGEWKPFVKDVEDGYDVIEWIGAQPWCTGRIGMVSASYEALTQWWSAAERPPSLKCIVPAAVAATRHSDTPRSGSGIPTQYFLWWFAGVTGRTQQNGTGPSWEQLMPTLPMSTLHERLGMNHSAWESYVSEETDFHSVPYAITPEQMAGIDIPVLVGVGWWDDQATMRTWMALQTAKSAKDCRLLVGAWDHGGNAAPRPVLGGIDVSPSVMDTIDYAELFLAQHLKGEINELATAPRCHVFETGRMRWDDLDQWPRPDAKEVAFHLASGGDARSLKGDGRLQSGAPAGGADRDTFTYDPNKPGRDMTNMSVFASSDPPLDNRYMLRRQDILVYDSEVLTSPLFVSGCTSVDLFVSSDCVDTDLIAIVYDVHPDGRAIRLGGMGVSGEGTMRLSYRDGVPPKPLTPGEVAPVHITGQWMHHIFKPGHRVRLSISSSLFPFLTRNPGTGEPWAEAATMVPQTNSIHHSAAHPSRLILPVVADGLMRFLDTTRNRILMHERIVAKDGVALSIDVYLPPEPGRYPVLMHRTPADNSRPGRATPSGEMLPSPTDRWKALAAQGFIVATGDVRGRGDSDGEFTPFVHEGSDGLATAEWLRHLPECNGKVGAFGSGYSAFCAWAALAEGADIDAIVSISPFGAVGEGLVHRGGAVRLDWLFWMHLIGGRTLQPATMPPWPKIHRHWPLATMDEALGREDTAWRDWIAHADPADAYWAPLALADKIAKRPVPALHVTGWWDAHLGGARYYYDAAKRAGAPQSLIVGPWDAAAVRRPRASVGGIDFGCRSLIDADETLADYFSATLGGEDNAFAKPVTRLFITGRNEWIDGDGWPAARSGETLRLSSTHGANTRRGDGMLGGEGAGIDEVCHNPSAPVDIQQNFVSFASSALTFEQAYVTARDEALVYTTKPLAETLTVSGQPKVTLTVSADAPDADLFVLLSDEFPLGTRDLHLSHTAIRLATVDGFAPGKPVTVTLDLDELAHDFLPGHSVRLTVTPSLFPLYARNPQAADYANASEPRLATIVLRHGAESLLRLPKG